MDIANIISRDIPRMRRGESGDTTVSTTVIVSGGASSGDLDAHIGNADVHITAGDRNLWNNKLDATLYTPADVLAKLKTVDGIGSGLDADTVRGYNSDGLFVSPRPSIEGSDMDVFSIRAPGAYPVVRRDADGQEVHTDALVVFKSGGNASAVELLANYQGKLSYRVSVDDSRYGIWSSFWTSANFDPALKLDVSRYTPADVLAKLKTVDGIGSGLDADLFRGRTPDEFKGNFLHTIDASALDQDTYYPVTIPLRSRLTTRISVLVSLDSNTTPAWSTHSAGFSVRFIEEVNGCSWGASAVHRTIFANIFTFCHLNPIGRVSQMLHSGIEVIWVRGGGRYYFYTDADTSVVLRATGFAVSGETVMPTTIPDANLYDDATAVIGVKSILANNTISIDTQNADAYFKIATDSREWWAGVGAASGDDHFVIYDKTAQKIRLQVDTAGNVSVGTYVPGLFGTGINLAAEKGEIECTKLFVRGSLVTNELVVNQLSATNGALIVSDSVELIGDAIRDQNNSWNITQSAIKGGFDSGFICPFVIGDYIRCQKWTNDHTVLRSYFAKVVWANSTSFTLPGDIEQPKAGDVIVRWNSDHESRKGLLYLTSSDTNAPYMEVVYNGAAVMRLGNLTGFDGLTGYGIAYPGKFHLSSGGTARISGWNFDSEELYSDNKSFINLPSVAMYSKPNTKGVVVMRDNGNYAAMYNNSELSFGQDIQINNQLIFRAGRFDGYSGIQIGTGGYSIFYDASSGRMTFGAAVSLNWSGPINSITTALGGASYSKLTKIDANGIYTGTLTADQITTGYLSAARIAAGTITAEKLQAGLVLGEDAIFSGSIKIGDVFNVDKNGTGNWGILSVNDKNVQINRADGAGVFLFNTSLPSVADFAGQQQNGYFVAEINDAYDSIIPTTVTGVVGQFVVTPGEPIGRSKLITFAAPTTASNLIFSMRQFEADMPIRVTLRIKIQRQIGANWEDIATFYNRSFSSSGQNSPYMFTDTALGGKCVVASGDTIRMAYEIRYDKAIGAYGAFGVTLQARGNPVCSYTYAVSSLLNSVSVYPDGLAYIKSTDRHFHISGAGAIDKLSLSAWVSDFNLRIGPGLKIYSLDADGKNHLCVGGIYTATVNSPTSSPLPADKTIRLVRCSNFLEYVNKKPDSYIFIATTM